MEIIRGFSKLSADEKINTLVQQGLINREDRDTILQFRHRDAGVAATIEKFTENVISSYQLPLSIAPNFLINKKVFHLPMVVEESSVVAAASWSAGFWARFGGFSTRITGTVKTGQIHYRWDGELEQIEAIQKDLENTMRASTARLTENMEKRGGGITGFEWLSLDERLPGVMQCLVSFETADSMGANFINSCLEQMAPTLVSELGRLFPALPEPEIIMAILSNYTPDCLVECCVETSVKSFEEIKGVEDGFHFARRFKQAVDIAIADPYRAVTHNKGIFNGMDAVILATANDFRAFEAGGHAYAARNGRYTSLTQCELTDNTFRYTLRVPAAIGTVGGLTATHPLARLALKILGNPGAAELMSMVAAAGLANNFSAIKALTTTGIQSGHMKMHLSKILMQLNATDSEAKKATDYFSGKTVSHREVADYLDSLREN